MRLPARRQLGEATDPLGIGERFLMAFLGGDVHPDRGIRGWQNVHGCSPSRLRSRLWGRQIAAGKHHDARRHRVPHRLIGRFREAMSVGSVYVGYGDHM
jgi:hypothetical protein